MTHEYADFESFRRAIDERWREHLQVHGLAAVLSKTDPLTGKLLRPLAMYHAARATGGAGASLVDAALALQLIHSASLLHDDVLDNAMTRRGAANTRPADLVLGGDLLLTSAYALAAEVPMAGSRFAWAVQRMARGEAHQGTARGAIDYETYRRVITDKSGALFGWAFYSALVLNDKTGAALEAEQLGDRLGYLYQLLDDYLDWCPFTETGKPPLQDARQGKHTLPLFFHSGSLDAAGDVSEAVRTLFADGSMERALAHFEAECEDWLKEAAILLGRKYAPFAEMVHDFQRQARGAWQHNYRQLVEETRLHA